MLSLHIVAGNLARALDARVEQLGKQNSMQLLGILAVLPHYSSRPGCLFLGPIGLVFPKKTGFCVLPRACAVRVCPMESLANQAFSKSMTLPSKLRFC